MQSLSDLLATVREEMPEKWSQHIDWSKIPVPAHLIAEQPLQEPTTLEDRMLHALVIMIIAVGTIWIWTSVVHIIKEIM